MFNFFFSGAAIVFSTMAVPSCIPTITLIFCFCCFNSHPIGYEVVAHCGFGLRSLIIDDVNIFPCVYWLFGFCLWRKVYSSPLPIFNQFVILLSYRGSCCILDFNSLIYMWFASIFSHIIGCFFMLLIVSFDAQIFSIFGSLTYLFFFCCLYF